MKIFIIHSLKGLKVSNCVLFVDYQVTFHIKLFLKMRLAKNLIALISRDFFIILGTLRKFRTTSTSSIAESVKCLY